MPDSQTFSKKSPSNRSPRWRPRSARRLVKPVKRPARVATTRQPSLAKTLMKQFAVRLMIEWLLSPIREVLEEQPQVRRMIEWLESLIHMAFET